MSFFRCTSAFKPAARRGQVFVRPAAFSTTCARRAGKESAVHEDSEKRAAEADAIKKEELNKQKQGKNEWREEIASDSEEAVMADRGELKASDENIKQMQEETKGPSKSKGPQQ